LISIASATFLNGDARVREIADPYFFTLRVGYKPTPLKRSQDSVFA
jgi:hypothetical protein